MLKIIVVSQYLDLYAGGAERYIYEVCSRLETRHGCTVRYVSGDTWLRSGLSKRNLRLFSSGFNLKWYAELKELFQLDKPDIIYIHYTVPGISDAAFYAARRLHIPCAVMYHSDVTGTGWMKKSLGYIFYYLSLKRMIEGCEFLYVSSHTYMKTSPFLSKTRREYVLAPPGIDDIFGDKDENSEGFKENSIPFILFVGKPDLKEKGFHILRQAWQILKRKGRKLDLVVAGEKKNLLKKHGTKDTGLIFIGKVESRKKLSGLYCSALVTVLPSLSSSESFGMVAAEALASGCPVIGSKIGGIPELITDNENGYLVCPGDVDSLVNALENTFENNQVLRNNIQKSKKEILARYNWDNTAATVAESFYRNRGCLIPGPKIQDLAGGCENQKSAKWARQKISKNESKTSQKLTRKEVKINRIKKECVRSARYLKAENKMRLIPQDHSLWMIFRMKAGISNGCNFSPMAGSLVS